MKSTIKIIAFTFLIAFSASAHSAKIVNDNSKLGIKNSEPDSLVIQYSLFSEYYKNKDFEAALPYGWKVLKMDPARFAKYIYFKMEDILWSLHDSTTISPEMKKSIEDTIMYVYDLALKYDSTDRTYFEPRIAFVEETWLNAPVDKVIKDYEKAIADDPNMSDYYYNRLGILYKTNQSDSNDYKTKAIDLYTKLNERDPDNPQWNAELESLVENIDELVQLQKKAWEMDKDNTEKAWKFVSTAMRANMYSDALEGLKFLVQKSPSTLNYWTQLAIVYEKTQDYGKAEEAYKKLIELDPQKKENYLYLGNIYKDRNQYSLARTYYEKASSIGNNWGLPILYLGLLYEQSARSCKFDIETKLVYLLAVETYRRAKNMDPTLDQAASRITALQSSIPSKEDIFFRGWKTGQTIAISGDCYGWIQRSVTIP